MKADQPLQRTTPRCVPLCRSMVLWAAFSEVVGSIHRASVSAFAQRAPPGAVRSLYAETRHQTLKWRVGVKKVLVALGMVVACVVGFQFLTGVGAGLFGAISNDLAIREEVVKGLEAARPFQAAVSQRYSSDSFVCTSSESCGLEDESSGRYAIAIGPHAVITITYSAISPNVDGKTVILKPRKKGDSLRWDCRGGTVPGLYRPAACRSKQAGQG